MKKIRLIVFLLLILPLEVFAQEKVLLGWVEKVLINPGNIEIDAKLDTGADYSSLDAPGLTEFELNGKPWVRFEVRDQNGKISTIEREVKKITRVKSHHGKGQKRKVVRIGICLGKIYKETDVNLVDRTEFDYQLLIGRTFLAGNAIIDPSVSFTTHPTCKIQQNK